MEQTTVEKAYKQLNRRYYSVYVRAMKKGYDFDLELYDIDLIFSSPCVYCNAEHSGIDRKDNSKGYTKGNVVSCCRRCNTMKGSQLDYQEMIELGIDLMISDSDEDWF